jgi:predicted NBD/HSP70 family sugar kinase
MVGKEKGSIGIDVGGTKTLFALFDPRFRLEDEIKIKTHDSENAKHFAAAVSESLGYLLKKAEKEHWGQPG